MQCTIEAYMGGGGGGGGVHSSLEPSFCGY